MGVMLAVTLAAPTKYTLVQPLCLLLAPHAYSTSFSFQPKSRSICFYCSSAER
ncbi:Uncharacterised protein [Mycobacteroides abscessus subsp. abscessus]|nr:Uncharacterised protein [Mycobacteroides abscessus subsp. abscessus]